MQAIRPLAVLFDRDGTLIVNVPYNGDPEKVVPMPGAREALEMLRRARIPIAVVTNQSGIGRGYVSRAQVDAIHARVEALLGPFPHWEICPHAPDAGCECRKPSPGLIHQAAKALGVEAAQCVVIGDQLSDVHAAQAAGARAILVPSIDTPPEAATQAPHVAPDILTAVKNLL